MIRQTGSSFSAEPQELADAILDYAVCVLDSRGTILSCNEAAAHITGYTRPELQGTRISQLKAPAEHATHDGALILQTSQSQGKFDGNEWLQHKSGHLYRAHVLVYPLDPHPSGQRYVMLLRNVTNEYEAIERLRESERQFRMLVEGVVDYAIFMLDRDGKVTNWNSGAERIKGYTAAEVLGRHFSCFYTEEDQANGLPQRSIEHALRDGQFEAEGWRVRKDGTQFWASVVLDAIHAPDGELLGFAKITRDITEQRKAQVALDEARAQLAHAQRMESIGQLTGGIAHDFNNLLTGMIGSLELLQKQLKEGAEKNVTRYADAALGAAHRAASLTHRLLAFARRQPLDPEAVNANTLVRSLAELFRRTLGENITLEFETASDLWLTRCDPHQSWRTLF